MFRTKIRSVATITGCTFILAATVGCAPTSAVSIAQPLSVTGKNISQTNSTGHHAIQTTPVKHTNSSSLANTPAPVFHLGDAGSAVLYLNEALSQLHYLPVQFTVDSTQTNATSSANPWADAAATRSPLQGQFTWAYPALSSTLGNLWDSSAFTILTKGAVMTFELHNGLSTDGICGPQVWHALQRDLAAGNVDPQGYVNITVEKRLPETLQVWINGKVVYTSLANTGVSEAPTENGTWPIYLRYQSQTMQGVTPWGTPYSDPGIPWVNYFHGGDAVHGFIRESYGFPQSLGCVELPINHAAHVFSLVNYGTLVTVCNQISS